jgi:hypothetical protein
LLNEELVNFSSPLPIPQGGWNELIVLDSIGCQRHAIFFVDSPGSLTGVDWHLAASHGFLAPGFSFWLDLMLFNDGCLESPAEFVLDLPDGFTVESCSHPYTQIDTPSGSQLIWQLEASTFEDPAILIELVLIASTSLQIGESVCFSGEVTSAINDILPENNVWLSCPIVLASYDPNDLAAFPEGKCEEHYVSATEPITYRVRFQNTGTTAATFVHVYCPVDTAFDLTSFNSLHSSHPMITELVNGELRFRFENIMLPDSSSNAEASQGYLFYQITPKANVPEGTVALNDARIYFDYNEPIFTNETFHTLTYQDVDTILCEAVSVTEKPANSALILYPNPTTGMLFCDELIHGYRLFNSYGKLIVASSAPTRVIDMSHLPDGVYLLLDGNSRSLRIIKS